MEKQWFKISIINNRDTNDVKVNYGDYGEVVKYCSKSKSNKH